MTPITTPGLAIPVYAELVRTRGRDSLQRAVLGLLRSGQMTATTLSTDLGIAEIPLVEAVLRSLADEGAVVIDEKLYRLNEEGGRAESGTGVRGWMFWDALQQRFIPRLFIDIENRNIKTVFAAEWVREMEWPEHFQGPDSTALWRAVQRVDFSILLISRREEKREMAPDLDRVVRSICISDETRRRRFPLVAFVETRLRIAGEPALFFHEPQVTQDDLSEPIYAPALGGLLENVLPAVFGEVRAEAQRRNEAFLRENNAGLIGDLGGREKIQAEAEAVVREQLRGISLQPDFGVAEAHAAAREAEINRILWRHNLLTEASVRRDFATLLQLVARILGDRMAEFLSRKEFKLAFEKLETELDGLSNNNRERVCKTRIELKFQEYGLQYRGWKLETHLKRPDQLRSALDDPGHRSQLGSAFVLWLIPPVLVECNEVVTNHLDWIRSALRECPDLLDIFLAAAQQRHLDKASKTCGVEMPLEAFATNTYRIWRALGAAI